MSLKAKTVALANLGCSKNQVDGEGILGFLAAEGFRIVDEFAAADIILVNTCAFIQEAKQEAIDTILALAEYKNHGTCQFLGVCCCFSERYRADAAPTMPEVDRWFGVHTWREEFRQCFLVEGPSNPVRHLAQAGATQYLKIAEGCSRRCSFCVIPAIRGPFHSRSYEQILEDAQRLAAHGTRECILVSQDTTSYGTDTGTDLQRLLERLLVDTPFDWLRLMYLHPAMVHDSLIDLIASEKRLCSYFDIPLQHISDHILKRMHRHPTRRGTYELIERIRTRAPDAAIRTTCIVGFPGETEREFDELLRFVEWARFEKLGVFPFSPEEGTPAQQYRPRPRHATAARRCETLLEAQREISRSIGERRVGTEATVVVDRISDDECCDFIGRTQWDAPEVDGIVHVRSKKPDIGVFTRVRVTDADAYDLYGVSTTE